MDFQIAQIFDSFYETFSRILLPSYSFFRNWLRMVVIRITEKYLKVFVFDCDVQKFHDSIGVVPW